MDALIESANTVYCIYLGQSIWGLSYTWEGVSALTHTLPPGSAVIEKWDLES